MDRAPVTAELVAVWQARGPEQRTAGSIRGTSQRRSALHHALGLTLTRLKQPDAALAALRKATELELGQSRHLYVYAVAWHSGSRGDEESP
jgi:hypothetical protein